ncbi:unnamed protein product [Cylindrotheca closterium]|uniref:L domain-like protein n=1 Tax=Cylindrotheca closterium TaxID=2856 RepID=A0AAD2JH28_9STRA|nr:unnamed protein product [Cylindrotheca closterium]
MAVDSTEQTNLLRANEDIELQHSEVSGKAVILPTGNILPERRLSDIARDTKRILEIAYGSEDGDQMKSDSMENTAEIDEESEDDTANNQSKMGGTGTYNETVELKEGQFLINGYVINPLPKKKKATTKSKKKTTKAKKDSNKEMKKDSEKPKKKTTKKKKQSDGTNVSNTAGTTDTSNVGQAADASIPNSEAESLLNTIDENAEGEPSAEATDGGKAKKKKKKGKGTKKKKKKKKKKIVVLGMQRDAAGRIVRKRKYIKHRHKVVKKHLIKNGKDAKVSLDPILETDEDMENSSRQSSVHSRNFRSSVQNSSPDGDGSNHGLEPSDSGFKDEPDTERSKTDAGYYSDESDASFTSSEYSYYDSDDEVSFCFTTRGIVLIACLVCLSVGLGIGLTYYFLERRTSGPPTIPITSAPSGSTPSPTVVVPTPMPTFLAPTISSMPSLSPTTAEPTATPVPTIETTTLAPTLNRFEYLSQLVTSISPEYMLSGTPQANAFEWMTTRDLINWSDLQDRELLERYIFTVFYFAMGGSQWNRDKDWLSDLHICDWYGLACYLDVFVVDIFLEENGMIGRLPVELSNLMDLESISIELNVVEEGLPSELGSLTKLTDLALSSTANLDFQGSLPSEIGNMSNLRRLRMRSNGLTGMIPGEIGMLSMLTELDLSQNDLSGSIPDTITSMDNLRLINLSWNLFDGSIPSSLFNLTQLVSLDLDINYFNGPVPEDFVKLSNLEVLSIAQNTLTGTLPENMGEMTMLQSLRLQNNVIRGTIPSEGTWGRLTNMEYLFLSSNQISGTIPSFLGNMSGLLWLDLSKNLLTGIVPSEVKNLTSAAIDVYDNKLDAP